MELGRVAFIPIEAPSAEIVAVPSVQIVCGFVQLYRCGADSRDRRNTTQSKPESFANSKHKSRNISSPSMFDAEGSAARIAVAAFTSERRNTFGSTTLSAASKQRTNDMHRWCCYFSISRTSRFDRPPGKRHNRELGQPPSARRMPDRGGPNRPTSFFLHRQWQQTNDERNRVTRHAVQTQRR